MPQANPDPNTHDAPPPRSDLRGWLDYIADRLDKLDNGICALHVAADAAADVLEHDNCVEAEAIRWVSRKLGTEFGDLHRDVVAILKSAEPPAEEAAP